MFLACVGGGHDVPACQICKSLLHDFRLEPPRLQFSLKSENLTKVVDVDDMEKDVEKGDMELSPDNPCPMTRKRGRPPADSPGFDLVDWLAVNRPSYVLHSDKPKFPVACACGRTFLAHRLSTKYHVIRHEERHHNKDMPPSSASDVVMCTGIPVSKLKDLCGLEQSLRKWLQSGAIATLDSKVTGDMFKVEGEEIIMQSPQCVGNNCVVGKPGCEICLRLERMTSMAQTICSWSYRIDLVHFLHLRLINDHAGAQAFLQEMREADYQKFKRVDVNRLAPPSFSFAQLLNEVRLTYYSIANNKRNASLISFIDGRISWIGTGACRFYSFFPFLIFFLIFLYSVWFLDVFGWIWMVLGCFGELRLGEV